MSDDFDSQLPSYQNAQYLKSALKENDLPIDRGIEVAFIGRSNAGKSSALNTITGIKSLARTSKTPGRTQMINFFSLDDNRRLVDLPGYGYAKVPTSVKERWEKHVTQYLQERKALTGLVVIADIRHPLKAMDEQIIQWAIDRDLPLCILLTKRDKLSNHQAAKALQDTNRRLREQLGDRTNYNLLAFSAVDKSGLNEVLRILNGWFSPSSA